MWNRQTKKYFVGRRETQPRHRGTFPTKTLKFMLLFGGDVMGFTKYSEEKWLNIGIMKLNMADLLDDCKLDCVV